MITINIAATQYQTANHGLIKDTKLPIKHILIAKTIAEILKTNIVPIKSRSFWLIQLLSTNTFIICYYCDNV